MQEILRVIDHMTEKFPIRGPNMPVWMRLILEELQRYDISLSVRIFLIKIILNKSELFK